MKSSKWSFAVLGRHGSRRVRTFSIPVPVIVLAILVTIAGFGGLCRLGFFAFSYAYGRIGAYQERTQNRILLSKLQFLCKYLQRESRHVESLAGAEASLRLKFGLDPIPGEVRSAGVGGRPAANELLSVFDLPVVARADSVKDHIQQLLRRTELQSRTFAQVLDHVRDKRVQWAERPSTWPVFGRITSGYGYRMHPIEGVVLFHEGIDIANKPWTPVFATGDGIVRFAGAEASYGNLLIIDHRAAGVQTVYAHLIQKPVYVEGQIIRRGDLVGFMGNTGLSTGNHLHYEIRKSEKPVDPYDYIVPVDVVVD